MNSSDTAMNQRRARSAVAAIVSMSVLACLLTACATARPKPSAEGEKASKAAGVEKEKPKAPKVSREAIEQFKRAIELYRRQAKARDPDYDAMITAFERVLEIDPKMAEAHYNLGCIYEAMHQPQKAIEHYRKALEIRPDLGPAAANWGALLARQGKLEKALRLYRRALSKESKNSVVLLNMAAIYRRKKLYDDAVKTASEVLIRDPSNVGAYRIMASVYYEKGDLDMAHLLCLRGLKVAEGDPQLLNTLGLVLLKMGKIPEALANFRAALAKAPDMLSTRFNIAKVALDYRDFDVARRQFEKILEYQPNNRKAAIGLGIALRGSGRFDEAKKHFLALAKKWPRWALPQYWLGMLELRNFNNPKAAQGRFKAFIELAGSRLSDKHPAFALLKECRQQIEMERKMKEMERRAMEEARRQAELEKKLADERARRLDAAWKEAEEKGGVLPPRKLDARQLPFVLIPPAINPEKNNRIQLFGMPFEGIKNITIGNLKVKWKQIDKYTLQIFVPKWLGLRSRDVYGPWDVAIYYRDKNRDPIVFQGGLWVGKEAPPKKKPVQKGGGKQAGKAPQKPDPAGANAPGAAGKKADQGAKQPQKAGEKGNPQRVQGVEQPGGRNKSGK